MYKMLTSEEKHHIWLRKKFEIVDSDQSGKLERDELITFFELLNLNTNDAHLKFRVLIFDKYFPVSTSMFYSSANFLHQFFQSKFIIHQAVCFFTPKILLFTSIVCLLRISKNFFGFSYGIFIFSLRICSPQLTFVHSVI